MKSAYQRTNFLTNNIAHNVVQHKQQYKHISKFTFTVKQKKGDSDIVGYIN